MNLNCCMLCCAFPYAHSSFAIILMWKRKLVALPGLSSWCLVIVLLLFLAVPWVCLRFVIMVFPVHTHLLILISKEVPPGILFISLAIGSLLKLAIITKSSTFVSNQCHCRRQ